jgi:hypothetical protein
VFSAAEDKIIATCALGIAIVLNDRLFSDNSEELPSNIEKLGLSITPYPIEINRLKYSIVKDQNCVSYMDEVLNYLNIKIESQTCERFPNLMVFKDCYGYSVWDYYFKFSSNENRIRILLKLIQIMLLSLRLIVNISTKF